MPLPLGHAAVGIAVADVFSPKESTFSDSLDWKRLLFITFLANLPDFDMFLGLFLKGNGNYFHRSASHSILVALLMGVLVSQAWKWWDKIPRIGMGLCFLIILSHGLTDVFCTSSSAALFWPFETYSFAGDNRSWSDVLNIVFLQAFRDTAVLTGSALVIFLNRFVRSLLVKTRIPASQPVDIAKPSLRNRKS